MEVSEHVAERIFDEIKSLRTELGEKIDAIALGFAKEAAKCEDCRPIVMGNGRKPIDVRVDRLEGVLGRIRWTLTVIVAPVTVYGLYALLQHWLKLP